MASMKTRISDVQIIPVKPKDGLVAFANILYDDNLFLGSIAIHTRPTGSYRLSYPKKESRESYSIFHPINSMIAKEIDDVVIAKYEKMTKVIGKKRKET